MRRSTLRLLPLTGLDRHHFDAIVAACTAALPRARGRPWSLPLPERVLLTVVALRTNLTIRQLTAVFGVSKTQTHRIIDRHTRLLAALLDLPPGAGHLG